MQLSGAGCGILADRIRPIPLDDADGTGRREVDALRSEIGAASSLANLAESLADERLASFLAGVIAGSPYLKAVMLRNPARLQRLLAADPAVHFYDLTEGLHRDMAAATEMAAAMRLVRAYKSEVALLVALADLGEVWPVMTVTETLTKCADAAVQTSVDFLFRLASGRGDIAVDPGDGGANTGYIVLGMGKYGAAELNYSSDIDLIVFYDLSRARLKKSIEPSPFFVRITRDLVRLLDERTADGYVFRTDLRLRPDAGATQVALSTDAAMIYYESFGQNWERAALIKARPVAGDREAGARLLSELSPFIWRRYLDYAAIADIHAMKRQIHAFRGFGSIGVAGHNVKLGPGGIREIEFFAQTQQLIAGGRQPDLRVPRTLDALICLEARNWIRAEVRADLSRAYVELRRIEHRVQMVADEQTHELPSDEAALQRLARFAGFASLDDFTRSYTATLERVQQHYSELFESAPELTGDGANMVFAGERDDPDTVGHLKKLGFSQPSEVLSTVRGWHHGRYPAVRSARARELLTEVQFSLISALAETADSDLAFAGFDRFLAALPGSVQLFSLLKANPGLLRLVSDIMGTAPRLARVLAKRPRLLDAVIDPRAMTAMPAAAEIDAAIAAEIASARDQQDILDRMRVVGSEQSFLIGVKILSGTINAGQAGGAYALLADRLITALHRVVGADLERTHGTVPGGGAAVIAMGKLGGREMTASSDLDLIVVYDFDEAAAQSTGERPLAPSQYYARFTQRLVTALTAPTAEGTLYDVDLRLRPSGQKGPVATQLSGFVDYQISEAWTWEHLALTRARVVSGGPELREKVEAAVRATLVHPRDRAKVAADVRDMRARIAAEKGTDNIWDLKQVRGGLVDLEFIAQYLQLVHAAHHPGVLDQNTCIAFQKLGAAGCLDAGEAEALISATRLIHDLTQVFRLCQDGVFDPAAASKGLKELAARAGDCPSFEALELKLKEVLGATHDRFERLVV
ncbi:MAG: bifunctional [glutamine synthetase] adenylyltransferase/[glutamine synthetase]-adenylyl-L-tyrosine phosphorylase [Deltaproteobacteria bacterium]